MVAIFRLYVNGFYPRIAHIFPTALSPGPAVVPLALELAAGIHSPESFIRFTRPVREGPALRFTILLEIYDGEKAATFSRMYVKHQGEFAGIAPSGRELDVTRIDNFLIIDGKIREVKTTLDHEAFRARLLS